MGYIKAPKAYAKLKKAEESFAPVILTAANGYGKSAAVSYYYRRKKPLILYCKDGMLTKMPSVDSFRESVVIIEDMQWLSDDDSIRYLKGLLHTSGIQVVMLTRGGVPRYLATEQMDLGFVRIQETDLTLGEKEVAAFFKDRGITLEQEEIAPITQASQGYPRVLLCYAARMEGGEHYSEDLRAAVRLDLFHLWDGYIYEHWPESFIRFALCVCRYDAFTQSMAEYLTGDPNVGRMIDFCCETMSQIDVKWEGCFTLRREIRLYYCWKQELVWTKDEINANYCKAAEYYEKQDDMANALKYYRIAGATDKVKELLIRNASVHPGTGHYIETKEYYFDLPEEEVREMPVLMAGMSMLYDLLLMPDLSEEWYEKLKLFCEDPAKDPALVSEAKIRLLYLDIALPHRETGKLEASLQTVNELISEGKLKLPEFGVTGNNPSIINGGLDMSEWLADEDRYVRLLDRCVQNVFGRYGRGFLPIAKAEAGFERSTLQDYDVMSGCSRGFEEAIHGGRIEICFAAVGVQAKQYLISGNFSAARRIAESFGEKVRLEQANILAPNLEAFNVWLSLFGGSGEELERYIDSVPDVKVTFALSDRYRQIIKLRCLIAEERLDEALELSLFLTGYFKTYHRYYHFIENELLQGIILYRSSDEHWKEHMLTALKEASTFGYVRVISLEGAAVLPLLKKLKEEGLSEDIPETYLSEVMAECYRVASSFPDYMKYIPKEFILLTDRETQVLYMLLTGMSTDEICRELGIGYDGLKKHNRSIYKKLGAKDRADAERKAIQLGLVHRGGLST